MDVYCYVKCTTCQKALKWLDEKGVPYRAIDIKSGHPGSELGGKTVHIIG